MKTLKLIIAILILLSGCTIVELYLLFKYNVPISESAILLLIFYLFVLAYFRHDDIISFFNKLSKLYDRRKNSNSKNV